MPGAARGTPPWRESEQRLPPVLSVAVWGGRSMSDEPIPLYDGELSGAKIIPEGAERVGQPPETRVKRQSPRHKFERVHVCFSPMYQSGRVEHVECPVIDMSESGLAIEYDRRLGKGITGHVSYRTISNQPVRVSCTVRRCAAMDNGHFEVGVQLNRRLRSEEMRPAKTRPGRELAAGVRARKLRVAVATSPPV